MTEHEPSEQLRRLLQDDEELVWVGKPQKAAWYVGTTIAVPLAFGLVGLLFGVPFGAIMYLDEGSLAGMAPSTVAVYAGIALLGLAVLAAVLAHLSYRHKEVAVTDRRVIHLHGVVGRDASVVELDDVRDVDVDVVPADKPWGTGSLVLQVAGGAGAGVRFAKMEDPYALMDRVEEIRSQAR